MKKQLFIFITLFTSLNPVHGNDNLKTYTQEYAQDQATLTALKTQLTAQELELDSMNKELDKAGSKQNPLKKNISKLKTQIAKTQKQIKEYTEKVKQDKANIERAKKSTEATIKEKIKTTLHNKVVVPLKHIGSKIKNAFHFHW